MFYVYLWHFLYIVNLTRVEIYLNLSILRVIFTGNSIVTFYLLIDLIRCYTYIKKFSEKSVTKRGFRQKIGFVVRFSLWHFLF